jgi:hypothetical protein
MFENTGQLLVRNTEVRGANPVHIRDEVRPLFKFNDEEFTDSLVQRGNIRIGTLHEFRNDQDYAGNILDAGEGMVTLENYYHHYAGLAKDADGLLPTLRDPYALLSVTDFGFSATIEVVNCNIFSTSRYLFTDSLWQAKADRDRAGKATGCCVITDPDAFFSALSRAPEIADLQFAGAESCRYLGRTIKEVNPGKHSITNGLLMNKNGVAFVKPVEHQAYREHRAVWMNRDPSAVKCQILDVPELAQYVLKIDVTQADLAELERLRDGKGTALVRTEVCFKDTDRVASFAFSLPNGVASPVIYNVPTLGRMLGFRSRHVGQYTGGLVQNAEVPIDFGRQALCVNRLERIQSIRISAGRTQ